MHDEDSDEIDLRCPQVVADNAAKGLGCARHSAVAAPRSAWPAPPN